MFDWQAELAVPALVSTSTQSRIPATTVTSSQIIPTKSFAAVLSRRSTSTDDTPLPAPCIKGDSLSITIGQAEYTKGVDECRNALRGRLTLVKGDKSYTARDLSLELGTVWKVAHTWKMVPLGRGYYDFHFESSEDLRRIWSAGTMNLKPGLLRLSQLTKDFSHASQK